MTLIAFIIGVCCGIAIAAVFPDLGEAIHFNVAKLYKRFVKKDVE